MKWVNGTGRKNITLLDQLQKQKKLSLAAVVPFVIWAKYFIPGHYFKQSDLELASLS